MVSKKPCIYAAVIMFFLSLNIYAHDADFFVGLWRGHNVGNRPELDSYIAVRKTGEGEYFVIYINPFWRNELDYAEYGRLTETGDINLHLNIVNYGEQNFFLKRPIFGEGFAHFLGSADPHPAVFAEKVLDGGDALREINNAEDLLEFIRLLNEE